MVASVIISGADTFGNKLVSPGRCISVHFMDYVALPRFNAHDFINLRIEESYFSLSWIQRIIK